MKIKECPQRKKGRCAVLGIWCSFYPSLPLGLCPVAPVVTPKPKKKGRKKWASL